MDAIEKNLSDDSSNLQIAAANRTAASFIAQGIRIESKQCVPFRYLTAAIKSDIYFAGLN